MMCDGTSSNYRYSRRIDDQLRSVDYTVPVNNEQDEHPRCGSRVVVNVVV